MAARPADRHRTIAGRFTACVRAVEDWDVAAPVADWRARDVVRHLTEWFPPFLAGGSGIHLPPGTSVDDDPVLGWETHVEAVQRLLDDPESAAFEFSNPHTGTMPLAQAVDRFYTTDVFMHTWDLARATGQDDRLDADTCAELVEGMAAIEDVMRSSGQFGPRVEVPADADAQTRMLGFIGRDPFWVPPRKRGGAPTPFVVYEPGVLLHGTKAQLAVGDLLVPGRLSNFEAGRVMNHVYVTETLDAAAWGAELALGDGPGRIYLVEPIGPIEDDPNVTDKKFPGNPTRSYRTREPVRVVGELTDWTGHTDEQIRQRRQALADLVRRGAAVIYD